MESRRPASDNNPTEKDFSPSNEEIVSNGTEIYSAVVRWLELNKQLMDMGEVWKVEKDKSDIFDDNLEAELQAIADGRSGQVLTNDTETIESDIANALKTELAELDNTIASLKENPTLTSEVRDKFREAKKYLRVARELQGLDSLTQVLKRKQYQLFKHNKGQFSSTEQKLLNNIARKLEAIDNRRQFLETSTDTALFVRRFTLETYQQQLNDGQFVETPSRLADMEWLEEQWQHDRPVLLSGHTGTGKTKMALHLAKKITGNNAELISGSEDLSTSDIVGRQGIRPVAADAKLVNGILEEVRLEFSNFKANNLDLSESELTREYQTMVRLHCQRVGVSTETYFIDGPFLKAIKQGHLVLIDEYNRIPGGIRFGLKKHFKTTSGETINLPQDGGIEHTVAEGYGLVVTANLQSDKHKEREALDNAEAREFNERVIDYVPADEAYDMALAKLLNREGAINLSAEDLSTTLKNLCDATTFTQEAYKGEQTAIYAAGGASTKKYSQLKTAVLDTGAMLAMLNNWPNAEAKRQSFQTYLNEQIVEFIEKGSYVEDRPLLIQIFTKYGFLQGCKINGFSNAELSALGVKSESASIMTTSTRLTIEDIAKLDPYQKRQAQMNDLAEGFRKSKKASSAEQETGLEQELNLREQYATQTELLTSLNIATKLDSGQMGIKDILNREQPMPTYEQIVEALSKPEVRELITTKVEQGFTQLLIVPIGLELPALIKVADGYFKTHNSATDDTYTNEGKNITNLTYGHTRRNDKHKPLHPDGLSHAEYITTHGSWQVLLIEDQLETPTPAEAQTISGRKQFSRDGRTRQQQFDTLMTDPQYQGEIGKHYHALIMQMFDTHKRTGKFPYTKTWAFLPDGLQADGAGLDGDVHDRRLFLYRRDLTNECVNGAASSAVNIDLVV